MKSVALRILYYTDDNTMTELGIHSVASIVNEELDLLYPFTKSNDNGELSDVFCDDLDYAIDELESRGLIDKRKDSDNSELTVQLTDRGEERIESLVSGSKNDEEIRRIVDNYAYEDADDLLQAVEKKIS